MSVSSIIDPTTGKIYDDLIGQFIQGAIYTGEMYGDLAVSAIPAF